jgi:acylglycerol lipase
MTVVGTERTERTERTQKTEETLTGTGGVRLAWWRYLPTPGRTLSAVVLLVHGYGEHQGRYAHLVARLNEQGYAVYTLDHRGHGLSTGRRALVDRFDDFVDDLRLVDNRARLAHPQLPRFVVGHSMGGLIAIRYALRYQAELRGLAVSAPAVRIGEETTPALRRLGALLARFTPSLPVMRPSAGGESLLSRDPQVQTRFDADRLNYHGPVQARMGFQLLQASLDARARLEELTLPLLVMQGDADRYVVPAGASELYERARSVDKTLKWWPGCRHELFNEPEQGAVIAYLLDWLAVRRPDLASPAAVTAAPAADGQGDNTGAPGA